MTFITTKAGGFPVSREKKELKFVPLSIVGKGTGFQSHDFM